MRLGIGSHELPDSRPQLGAEVHQTVFTASRLLKPFFTVHCKLYEIA